ncbi:MAG: hypothetical protein H6643_06515 [Caldilineaceae bacterium]|nr:hypothetical protein [Caldilineaceae bacterium]
MARLCAAGLAGHMQRRHGMYFNGLMLISSVLNFQTLHFEVGNDLPYVLFLPTYTATPAPPPPRRRLQQDLHATAAAQELRRATTHARLFPAQRCRRALPSCNAWRA